MVGPGNKSGNRGGGRRRDTRQKEAEVSEFTETLVKINRCAAVVKGGRRFSFSAIVVAGNGKGRVGMGFGKAKEVAGAIEKANKDALRNLVDVALAGTTIPHEVTGRYCSSIVKMRPAPAGRGVIACAAVRAVVESAGLHDIVTKSLGNNNPINLVKAAMEAVTKLRTRQQIEALRGVKLS